MPPTLLCPSAPEKKHCKVPPWSREHNTTENCPLWASSTAQGEGDRLGEAPLYPLHTPSRDGWWVGASSILLARMREQKPQSLWSRPPQPQELNQLLQAPLLGNIPSVMFPLIHTLMLITLFLHLSASTPQETRAPICSTCTTAPTGALQGRRLSPL